MGNSRKKYITLQREEKGKKIFGVFPAQYPKEILWAMNILPVEIWDPPVEISSAEAHLQPYICSVVKLGLELILQGKCDDLDGFLFPHTCDSIQNLASIVNDYLGSDKPCYFFYHPKSLPGKASRHYYKQQLKVLISNLEKQHGPLDISRLNHCVEQGNEIAETIRDLYHQRQKGELSISNAEYYKILRQGEYLDPTDYIKILKRVSQNGQRDAKDLPPVVLSGIIPNPMAILEILDELGVSVVDDDLLNCGRRLLRSPSAQQEPLNAITESYFSLPPCSTKVSSISERMKHLLAKLVQSNARGVIFNMTRFCEPELFDLPQLTKGLKDEGFPTLTLDTELNQPGRGQLRTRLETFAEMIR